MYNYSCRHLTTSIGSWQLTLFTKDHCNCSLTCPLNAEIEFPDDESGYFLSLSGYLPAPTHTIIKM